MKWKLKFGIHCRIWWTAHHWIYLSRLKTGFKVNCYLVSTTSQDIEDLSQCLQGNICRCTGYRPILEAFQKFNETGKKMPFEVSLPKSGNGDVNSLILNKNYFAPNNLEEVRKLMELHMFVLLHQLVTKDQIWNTKFLCFDFWCCCNSKRDKTRLSLLFSNCNSNKKWYFRFGFYVPFISYSKFSNRCQISKFLSALDIYFLFAILLG